MAGEKEPAEAVEPEAVVVTGGEGGEAEGDAAPEVTEAGTEGESAAEGGEPAKDGEPASDEAVAPKTPKWMRDRIDRATRQRGDAERKAEAETARATKAEEHAQRLRKLLEADGREVPDDAPAQRTPAMTKEDIEREATRIATQREDEARVRTESARVIASGAQKYGADKFEAARLEMVENFGQDLQQKPEFFDAIFGLENGEDAFYALAQNPDETARILSLSPARMGAEIAKIAAKKPPERKVSAAPAPITAVNGTGRVAKTVMDDDIGMDEFIRQREEQTARRRGAH